MQMSIFSHTRVVRQIPQEHENSLENRCEIHCPASHISDDRVRHQEGTHQCPGLFFANDFKEVDIEVIHAGAMKSRPPHKSWLCNFIGPCRGIEATNDDFGERFPSHAGHGPQQNRCNVIPWKKLHSQIDLSNDRSVWLRGVTLDAMMVALQKAEPACTTIHAGL